ncbi:hypothetical protein N2W54_001216 [Lotmaria passim]
MHAAAGELHEGAVLQRTHVVPRDALAAGLQKWVAQQKPGEGGGPWLTRVAAALQRIEVAQVGDVVQVVMRHTCGVQRNAGSAQRLFRLIEPAQFDLDGASVVQDHAILPALRAVVLRGVGDGLVGQVDALLRVQPQVPGAIDVGGVHEQRVQLRRKGWLLLGEGDGGAQHFHGSSEVAFILQLPPEIPQVVDEEVRGPSNVAQLHRVLHQRLCVDRARVQQLLAPQ